MENFMKFYRLLGTFRADGLTDSIIESDARGRGGGTGTTLVAGQDALALDLQAFVLTNEA